MREARDLAGLSQRELARRAKTAQSVVARIEAGQTSPSFETAARILRAAGFDLRTELHVRPVVDRHLLEDVNRILALTPEDRLREVANFSRLVSHARRV